MQLGLFDAQIGVEEQRRSAIKTAAPQRHVDDRLVVVGERHCVRREEVEMHVVKTIEKFTKKKFLKRRQLCRRRASQQHFGVGDIVILAAEAGAERHVPTAQLYADADRLVDAAKMARERDEIAGAKLKALRAAGARRHRVMPLQRRFDVARKMAICELLEAEIEVVGARAHIAQRLSTLRTRAFAAPMLDEANMAI